LDNLEAKSRLHRFFELLRRLVGRALQLNLLFEC